MSSLIFHTEKEQVLVATDTLATTPDGKPAFFTTKAFIVPHLNMIMCGTGISGFLGKWFIEVNDRLVIRGIDNLDYHTPHALADLWRKFKEEPSIHEEITTTVYHFGFSEDDGTIHTYVYRSTNNFKSETHPYGLGVKPECTINGEYVLPNDIKKMMVEQRAIQLSRPINERVYIGGKIQIIHLTKEGFAIYTLDHFDDYEITEREIFENYHSQDS